MGRLKRIDTIYTFKHARNTRFIYFSSWIYSLDQSSCLPRGNSLLILFLSFFFLFHLTNIHLTVNFPVRSKDAEHRDGNRANCIIKKNLAKGARINTVTHKESWCKWERGDQSGDRLTCWSLWWRRSWAAPLRRRFPERCLLCSEPWRSWRCGRNETSRCSPPSHCTPPPGTERQRDELVWDLVISFQTEACFAAGSCP